MSATTKKGRPTQMDRRIATLEKECEHVQTMIDNSREFAETTGLNKIPEFEMRLRVMQVDLDSKKLLINFLKASTKGL